MAFVEVKAAMMETSFSFVCTCFMDTLTKKAYNWKKKSHATMMCHG